MRAESVISQAGGKGVNISRASVTAGVPSIAVLPAPPDDPFVHELLAAGIDCRPVPTTGSLRVNITISEPDGTTTKLNSPGPTVTPDVLTALTESLRRRAGSADWVVLAGSLPPGAPVGWYAELVAALRDTGARIAVDTSDAPLRALVDGLDVAAPHLMKPNGEELASFTGDDPDALESDPVGRRPRRRDPRRPRRRDRARDARRRTAPYSSPPTAPGTPLPRRRPWSARSAPATPASSATSSGTCAGRTPTNDSRSPSPTAARPPDFPARPSRNPTRSDPSSSRSAASTLTPGG